KYLLRLAAALRTDKAVDEGAVDLGAEPGRRDQAQRGDPFGIIARQCRGDRAAHRMANEMCPFNTKRGDHIGHRRRQRRGIAGAGAATASKAPIGNVAPAAATTRRSVPASDASITLVILVVSISSSSSPSVKLSPSCFSQPRTFPSVIVRPHFGIVIGVISLID